MGGSTEEALGIAGVFLTQREAVFYFRRLHFIGLGMHTQKRHMIWELKRCMVKRTETLIIKLNIRLSKRPQKVRRVSSGGQGVSQGVQASEVLLYKTGCGIQK